MKVLTGISKFGFPTTHRAKVSTIANALEVETGGKGYLLAGGMDATTAFGLLQDVSKVMGLTIG